MREVMLHKATFTRPDGTVGGLVGLMLDITERKRAEASVRESRQLLQDIIDNSTALIYVKDLDGRFLLINRRMEELLRSAASSGLPAGRESVLGKTDYDLFPKEQADAYRDSDRQVLAAGKVMETEETSLQPRRGAHLPCRQSAAARRTRPTVRHLRHFNGHHRAETAGSTVARGSEDGSHGAGWPAASRTISII